MHKMTLQAVQRTPVAAAALLCVKTRVDVRCLWPAFKPSVLLTQHASCHHSCQANVWVRSAVKGFALCIDSLRPTPGAAHPQGSLTIVVAPAHERACGRIQTFTHAFNP
jgi:hypothetical protein